MIDKTKVGLVTPGTHKKKRNGSIMRVQKAQCFVVNRDLFRCVILRIIIIFIKKVIPVSFALEQNARASIA